jgi:DNA-binding response OmpR family regulator
MLALVLEIYGHRVRLIRTAGAAPAAAQDFQPDLVLLEVNAPVTSSQRDAAETLRAAAEGETQIFALCRSPQKLSDREQSLFDHVFSRPVRFGQLKPFLDAPTLAPRGGLGETVHSR